MLYYLFFTKQIRQGVLAEQQLCVLGGSKCLSIGTGGSRDSLKYNPYFYQIKNQYVYVYVNVCICLYVYVYMCMCMCVYVYV